MVDGGQARPIGRFSPGYRDRSEITHVVEGFEQVTFLDLRMLEHGRHIQHLAGRNTRLVEQRRPFGRRFFRERHFEFVLERDTIPLSIFAIGVTGMFDQIFPVLWTFGDDQITLANKAIFYFNSFPGKSIIITLMNFTNAS